MWILGEVSMSNVFSKAGANRRSFLTGAASVSAGVLAAAATGSTLAQAQIVGPGTFDKSKITAGDIAILKFLAAAELLEDDLWQQYSELAVRNAGFNRALRRIDRSLIRYIQDDRDDERSHANLINAFLVAIGEQPVNLDPFRTLAPANATGAANNGRLTSLKKLTVDTSWFNRYRGTANPDLGGKFDQFVTITDKPTVPLSNNLSEREYQAVAHAAAFHFCAIEQGGASLYNNLATKVSSPDVLRILLAIGPTELYHFVAFHKSLERLPGLTTDDGMVFPDLRENQDLAQAIFPEPCSFLRRDLPLCSVIRPSSTENAGAVAAATGLVASGLFAGQSNSFFDAVVALATAADKAVRS
jgi:hypothetical protein